MPGKTIYRKIKECLKSSILGPQNLGVGGREPGSQALSLDPHLSTTAHILGEYFHINTVNMIQLGNSLLIAFL